MRVVRVASFSLVVPCARRAGLYRWQVAAAAAQNALYGSTLSPPRQQQVREAVQQYMDSTTMEQDALWQVMSRDICDQMKVDTSVVGAAEELYASMRTHSLLFTKGERVSRLGLFAPESHAAAGTSVFFGRFVVFVVVFQEVLSHGWLRFAFCESAAPPTLEAQLGPPFALRSTTICPCAP